MATIKDPNEDNIRKQILIGTKGNSDNYKIIPPTQLVDWKHEIVYNFDYIDKLINQNTPPTKKEELERLIVSLKNLCNSEKQKEEQNRIMTDDEVDEILSFVNVLTEFVTRAQSGIVGLSKIREDNLKKLISD